MGTCGVCGERIQARHFQLAAVVSRFDVEGLTDSQTAPGRENYCSASCLVTRFHRLVDNAIHARTYGDPVLRARSLLRAVAERGA